MVEEGKRGPKEEKHPGAAVKMVNAFVAMFIGLILAIVTIYLLPLITGFVVDILYSSGKAPSFVYKAAWFISYLVALCVLIVSTVKIYGFLKRKNDL